MSEPLVLIHRLLPKAKDQMNGKEGECVVCSIPSGNYNNIQVTWQTLKGLIHLQNGEVKK
ncbi:unnamed protein product [marine sediment metagenome]|uniref:Uncharacterized protein n=1 Tax=marine sediment metagenome TaxID=412755 RepID=X0UKR8_9ZZZZ